MGRNLASRPNGRKAARAALQRRGKKNLKPRLLLAVPDLLVARLRYEPGTYYQGESLPFVAREVNNSDADAGSFQLQARLSKDQVWNDTDILIGDFPTDHIGAAREFELDVEGLIPVDAPPGIYYLGVKIDSDNRIAEGDEDNNIRWSNAPDVIVAVPPPLPEIDVLGFRGVQVTDGDSDPNINGVSCNFGTVAVNGETVTRTFTIRNLGNGSLNLTDNPKVRIGGANAAEFTVVQQPTSPLAANGGWTTFQVRFNPSAEGQRTATVSIANDDVTENPFDFTIYGTGTIPRAEVRWNQRAIPNHAYSPSAEDHTRFPDTSVGAIYTNIYSLVNTGQAPLHLVGDVPLHMLGSAGGQFTVQPSGQIPSAIAPGAEMRFTVTYRPGIGRIAGDRVYVATDDPANPIYEFDVSGLGLQPVIELSSDGVAITNDDHAPSAADHTDFGSTDINGGTVTRRFTIRSTGRAPLVLGRNPVSLVGRDAADFRIFSQPPSTLDANGGSHDFTIVFDPNGSGLRQTDVYVNNNGHATSNPFIFSIAGTGTGVAAPKIQVTGSASQEIVHNDATPAAADGTDFGSTEVGQSSRAHTFFIRSIGAGPLALGPQRPAMSIVGAAMGDFALEQNLPATLAAEGGTAAFQIVFHPTVVGARTAQVVINNDDADKSPFVFSIKGTGTAADIQVGSDGGGNRQPDWFGNGRSGDGNIGDGQTEAGSTDGTDFGEVDVNGGAQEHTFWIWNKGSVSLHLRGRPPVGIAGPNASDFTVTRQPGMTDLLAGSLANFKIRFDPSAVGERTATVQIASSDFDSSTFEFAIKGTGIVAQMRVLGVDNNTIPSGQTQASTASGTMFGSLDVNTGTRTRQFTVDNLGQATLHLSQSSVTGPQADDFRVTALSSSHIESGASALLSITFDPSLPGACNAVVSIPSNDGQTPYTFAVAGDATGSPWPEMSVSGNGSWGNPIADGQTTVSRATSTDLGSLAVDSESKTYDFSISNLGGGTLHLTGTPIVQIGGENASDFSITRQPSNEVASGRNTWFTIGFAPTAVGIRTAVIRIPNDDPDENPFDFVIQGVGGYPNMIVHSGSVDGPVVNPGSTPSATLGTSMISADGGPVVQEFVIQNTGQGTLLFAGSPRIQLTGSGAVAFSAYVAGDRVNAGGAVSLTLGFNPATGGTFQASVKIRTNDPQQSNYYFDVQGFWAAPVAEVTGNGVVIPLGATTPSTIDGTDFGDVDVSAGGVAHAFTIHNTGAGNLMLNHESPVDVGQDAAGSWRGSGDFSVAEELPDVIVPGASATFDIVFTPHQLGRQQRTVTLSSNDPSRVAFAVRGAGTGTLAPEIQVSGGSANVIIDSGTTTVSAETGTVFDHVPVSSGTDRRVFKVINTGNATLELGDVYFTGPAAGDFSAWPATHASLEPYDLDHWSVSAITVVFDPNAPGLRQAVINLPSDDPGTAVYVFALEGTGTIPTIQVQGNGQSIANGDSTPSASDGTDFGVCDLGSVVAGTFTVDNTGPAPLRLSGTPVVQVLGTNTGDFVVTDSPSRSAFPDTFEIEFRPSAPGRRTATVSIASNDLGQSPFAFNVCGTAVAGDIQVQGVGAQGISNGSTQPSGSNNTSFGSANTSSGSILRQFSIANAGEGRLNLSGNPVVAISGANPGDFVVERQAAGPLPPQGTTLFEIRFTPGASGMRRGTVTIASSDPDSGTFTFAIQGQGVSGPEIQVLGGSLLDQEIVNNDITPSSTDGTDFGQLDRGATVKSYFRIRNLGGSTLNLTGTPLVRIVSQEMTDFRISAYPSSSIAPGAQTQFTVEFGSTRHGLQTATLEIDSNDTDESLYRFDVRAEISG